MICIIITVYNREQQVEKAIASVLAQTHSDFKLLIWDDGSTDKSLEIAKSFLPMDERIEVITGKHEGASIAMKRAIAASIAWHKPKYIGWVDSDDWLHPQAIELMLPCFKNQPNLGVVYSDYMAVNALGVELGISRSARIPYSKERMLLDLISHHFRLLRATVYELVGGIDTTFKYNYDFDLFLKMSEVTSFQHFPQVLYKRLMHKDSITGSHRAEQIAYSRLAIEQALKRRGLDKSLKLEVCPNTGGVQLQIL